VSAALRRAACLAVALALPRAALAQEEAGGTRLGLRLAAYFPADAEVRRAFGDVIPWPGIAIVPPVRTGRTRLYPSLEIVGARSGRDHFVVVPLTLALEHHGRGSNGHYVPYARADAGIGYFDYRLRRSSTEVLRARRGGALGDAEVGMIFTRALRVGGRYRLMQEMDGVTFGGVEVGVVIGAVRVF
jgi:hypothetical protein